MGIWREIFGPSKEEAWNQFAAAVEGQFTSGGFWGTDYVEIPVGKWIVTLDTYTVSTGKTTVTYTRMRAPYTNPESFRFKVFRENGFGWLRSLFGGQDIVVGHPEFDTEYVIQGNDPAKLQKLFESEFVRAKLAADPEFWLEVRDDEGWFANRFPQGVDELYFCITGVITDVERLQRFFDAFAEVLHQLWWIEAAHDADPGIRLYEPKETR